MNKPARTHRTDLTPAEIAELERQASIITPTLTPEMRSAMLFFDESDFLEAEDDVEVRLVRQLTEMGLVGNILAMGRTFMDCRPLGHEVRRLLKAQVAA